MLTAPHGKLENIHLLSANWTMHGSLCPTVSQSYSSVHYTHTHIHPHSHVLVCTNSLVAATSILILYYTIPHHTAPHHTAPHRTAPHRTAPNHTIHRIMYVSAHTLLDAYLPLLLLSLPPTGSGKTVSPRPSSPDRPPPQSPREGCPGVQ